MNFGAAFIFDSQTETAMRGIWQSIADAGLPSFMLSIDYPPHLTIYQAEQVDEAGLRAALLKMAATAPPLAVRFPAVSWFLGEGGVAYLAPITNPALLHLHKAAWDASTPFTQGRPPYYEPGVWVPHATLTYNTTPEHIGPVTAVLSRAPQIEGFITGILMGRFNIEGNSQYEKIALCG